MAVLVGTSNSLGFSVRNAQHAHIFSPPSSVLSFSYLLSNSGDGGARQSPTDADGAPLSTQAHDDADDARQSPTDADGAQLSTQAHDDADDARQSPTGADGAQLSTQAHYDADDAQGTGCADDDDGRPASTVRAEAEQTDALTYDEPRQRARRPWP